MSERLVVLSTVARAEDGERIGRALVERGLAACVNVVPGLVSIYRWKGQLEREEERLLVIKTRRERFEELRLALVSLHPYEVPEVVALPIVDGHAPYLDWLDQSVGRAPARPARPAACRKPSGGSRRSAGLVEAPDVARRCPAGAFGRRRRSVSANEVTREAESAASRNTSRDPERLRPRARPAAGPRSGPPRLRSPR